MYRLAPAGQLVNCSPKYEECLPLLPIMMYAKKGDFHNHCRQMLVIFLQANYMHLWTSVTEQEERKIIGIYSDDHVNMNIKLFTNKSHPPEE